MKTIIVSLMLLFIGNIMPDKPTQQQTKTVKDDFDIVLDKLAKRPGRKSYHYKKAYIGILPNRGYVISRHVKGKPGYNNVEFLLITNIVRGPDGTPRLGAGRFRIPTGLVVELVTGAGANNVKVLRGKKAAKFLSDRKFSLKRITALFTKYYVNTKKKQKKRREGSF